MSVITDYSELYSKVITELPGCPTPLILQELQQSAASFCRKTQAWKEDLNSKDLEEDETTYNLNAPYDAYIHRILAVRINTEEGVTNGTEGGLQDPSLYNFKPETDSLVFTSAPSTEDITDALDVKAVLVPTVNAEGIAFWFINRYYDGIVGGAMAALASQANKEWTSPEVAAKYIQMKRQSINEARAEKNREFKEPNPGFVKE